MTPSTPGDISLPMIHDVKMGTFFRQPMLQNFSCVLSAITTISARRSDFGLDQNIYLFVFQAVMINAAQRLSLRTSPSPDRNSFSSLE